jgi:hypothetical protein
MEEDKKKQSSFCLTLWTELKRQKSDFSDEFHTSVPVNCHVMMILGDGKAEVVIKFWLVEPTAYLWDSGRVLCSISGMITVRRKPCTQRKIFLSALLSTTWSALDLIQ